MKQILDFLNGKKTYIIVAITIATAAVQAFGIAIPEWVYAVEAASGLGTVRVAISKASPPDGL